MPDGFYILSLKWSRGDMLTWYRPKAQGYTFFLDDAGIYTEEEARGHSYERATIAIPVEAAKAAAHLAVYDGKKDELIAAAAAAGFVLPPEPPPRKRERERCAGCGKFMLSTGHLCRGSHA